MTSYLYRAPSGVAGDITRPDATIVEPGLLNKDAAPTAFGVPVKIVNGFFEAFAAGDTGDDVYGFLSRIAPSISGDIGETYLSGSPNPAAPQGIVVRGYINVTCKVGTPVRGAPVYVRTVATATGAVGDIETAAVLNETVAIPGAIFAVDGKDANGVTEIRFKV